MDPALVARVNGIFNQVLQVPSLRTAISEAQAADIIGGTPQDFDAFIKNELKRWPDVVRASDRKSTRLNSSHLGISYAVFCLKKKKKNNTDHNRPQLKTSKAQYRNQ